VEALDSGTKDATRTIKVISLQGVDPLLVQQAIDAIQGRRTPTTQPGAGTPGFSPFGGRGGGGFNPGLNPGFNPGMTPGGRGGGGGPGGGGGAQPGGGRGGTTPQGRGPGSQSRGPDFFDS